MRQLAGACCLGLWLTSMPALSAPEPPMALIDVPPALSAARLSDAPGCRVALAALQAGEARAAADAAARSSAVMSSAIGAARPAAAPSAVAPPVAAAVPLARLRQQALQACLVAGSASTAAVASASASAATAGPTSLSQRQLRPAWTVPPLRALLSPLTLPAAALPPALPPGALPRAALPTITACDAGGCWASDGTRLQRTGLDLLGPRGFCQPQGRQLNCP